MTDTDQISRDLHFTKLREIDVPSLRHFVAELEAAVEARDVKRFARAVAHLSNEVSDLACAVADLLKETADG
jgi:hypothetical protein